MPSAKYAPPDILTRSMENENALSREWKPNPGRQLRQIKEVTQEWKNGPDNRLDWKSGMGRGRENMVRLT